MRRKFLISSSHHGIMKLYDCDKIHRLTIMYLPSGPGSYAGDKVKVLGPEESRAICQEANERGISIEKLLKSREKIESVVINLIVPFPEHVPKPQSAASKPEAEEKAQPAAGA
jgi:hypothetical protein